ncbi:MAG: hypothetical protein C4335_14420 [Armatimonadota bacterium]
MQKNKKGFTLIEMAIVLLVIGILAGIVLRNIGGQSAIARDTRRQGDLRNVSNYLATYMAKFGYFPTSTTWDALETELNQARITDRLPLDPQQKTGASGYNYFPCSDSGQAPSMPNNPANHFILRAQLEQTQDNKRRPSEPLSCHSEP